MSRLLQPPRVVAAVVLPALVVIFVVVACAESGRQVESGPVTRLAAVPEPAPAPPPIDFASKVRPILEAGCRPCHFEGGVMHEKLPFDRPETIHHLGEKLFTRIDDPGDQETIRAFLEAAP